MDWSLCNVYPTHLDPSILTIFPAPSLSTYSGPMSRHGYRFLNSRVRGTQLVQNRTWSLRLWLRWMASLPRFYYLYRWSLFLLVESRPFVLPINVASSIRPLSRRPGTDPYRGEEQLRRCFRRRLHHPSESSPHCHLPTPSTYYEPEQPNPDCGN